MKVIKSLFCLNLFLVFTAVFSSPAFGLVNSGTCTVKDDRWNTEIAFTLGNRLYHGANLTQNGSCKTKIKYEAGETFNTTWEGTLEVKNSDGLIITGEGATVVLDASSFNPQTCVFKIFNSDMWFKSMTINAPNHSLDKVFCDEGYDNHHTPGENGLIVNYKKAECGNGKVEEGEECDDSNGCCTSCEFADEGTACSGAPKGQCNDKGQCVSPPHYCGDGTKDPGEDCDGGECCTSTCDFAAQGTSCNDGILITINDQCDNQGECHGTPIVFSFCGDGHIDSGEVCDDGNGNNNDGCSSTCQVEAGWTCTTTNPSVCTLLPVCGNGTVEGSEACDDGDTDSGDGCSAACTVESGYTCTGTSPSVCTANPPPPVCGDGVVNTPTEQCDNSSECCVGCVAKSVGSPCHGGSGDQCNGSGTCQPETVNPVENPPPSLCNPKWNTGPITDCVTGGGCSLAEGSTTPVALPLFLLGTLAGFFLVRRKASGRK